MHKESLRFLNGSTSRYCSAMQSDRARIGCALEMSTKKRRRKKNESDLAIVAAMLSNVNAAIVLIQLDDS
jgi:hypothetical protein